MPVVGTTVRFDMPNAIRTATHRFCVTGRRKLAFIGWSFGEAEGNPDPSFQAFKAALAAEGLPFKPSWVQRDFQPNVPGAGWSDFREIWTGSAEKPDGLFVADDVLFPGVQQAIKELGIRVPEQLQVATHANRGSNMQYDLPVMRLETDPDEYAAAQVDLLLALLRHDPAVPSEIILPCRVLSAETTAPASAPGREAATDVKVTRSQSEQDLSWQSQPGSHKPIDGTPSTRGKRV